MPGMSGIEVARRIQAARPNTGIILSSGYADATDGSEMPADWKVIPKPYRLAEMAATIAAALKR